MKKKILLLGGSHGQLPAIIEAKTRGLYTILCDYLPDNPGKDLVDEFHQISTTDREAVLTLARSREIDFVLAYASDPATSTAAYISEAMGLPGNTFNSVQVLAEKDRFRSFQKNHGFNVPAFKTYQLDQNISAKEIDIPLPVIVKPVDSSDTKGVVKVEKSEKLEEAIYDAMAFSRLKRVIVEEFIDVHELDLHGDAFFVDGKMVFCMLGDRIFSSVSNLLKPSTELYPSRAPERIIKRTENEIAKIVLQSGFRNGAVNVEARMNAKGEMYILEIGPRSGGTLTPQTICYTTGFDMLKAIYDYFLNGEVKVKLKEFTPSICFALHKNVHGIFKTIQFDPSVEEYLAEKHIYVKPGDEILPYSSPGSTLGVLIMHFKSFKEADNLIDGLYDKVMTGIILE